MNVLYHLTILPPKTPGCDAVVQNVQALQGSVGGQVIYINPNDHAPLYVPRIAFGLDRLRELRELEEGLDLHHVFNPDPFPFPVFRRLRRPVVYSLTTGLNEHLARPARRRVIRYFSTLPAVTAADKATWRHLRSWGLENISLVRTGIDTSRFTHTPQPLRQEIKVMAGSAPWSRAQFARKGVHALLRAARQDPRLHLVFLWRNVLTDYMRHLVHHMGLERQVEVLNERVDVNRVLANVHASIVLATDPSIVVPFPHSLIESLAAGKPVLVSRCIAMAEYVEDKGCGQVVEATTAEGIQGALSRLARDYERLASRAGEIGARDFSQEEMIASFQGLYERVVAKT
jgi:glycosyltransferase involved in cell wall biosynthesis